MKIKSAFITASPDASVELFSAASTHTLAVITTTAESDLAPPSASLTSAAVPAVSDRSGDAMSEGSVARLAETKRRLRPRASDQGFLPIEIKKYLMLLAWTGRVLRRDKRGATPDHLAPILDRLGLERSHWVETVRDFGRMFKQAAGRWSSLRQAAPRRSRRWFQDKSAAQLAFLKTRGSIPSRIR